MSAAFPRVIPCLLLAGGGLYKTRHFEKPQYVGDPINAVRVFNDKEVDELVLLDIEASTRGHRLDLEVIEDIVSEAFMPICYGGGVRSVEDFDRLFHIGVEKVSVNSAAISDPALIEAAATRFGSQSVVVSIDVVAHRGERRVRDPSEARPTDLDPIVWARRCYELGAGELLVTAVEREGDQGGYDLELVHAVSHAVTIPILANGGAGNPDDFRQAFAAGAAGAVAGSMFVFNGPRRAVLISYLSPSDRASLS